MKKLIKTRLLFKNGLLDLKTWQFNELDNIDPQHIDLNINFNGKALQAPNITEIENGKQTVWNPEDWLKGFTDGSEQGMLQLKYLLSLPLVSSGHLINLYGPSRIGKTSLELIYEKLLPEESVKIVNAKHASFGIPAKLIWISSHDMANDRGQKYIDYVKQTGNNMVVEGTQPIFGLSSLALEFNTNVKHNQANNLYAVMKNEMVLQYLVNSLLLAYRKATNQQEVQ